MGVIHAVNLSKLETIIANMYFFAKKNLVVEDRYFRYKVYPAIRSISFAFWALVLLQTRLAAHLCLGMICDWFLLTPNQSFKIIGYIAAVFSTLLFVCTNKNTRS